MVLCFYLFKSSLGKKAVMAVTGLVLLGFVIAHMLGNLQIFLGPDWLNDYAKHLQDLPLLLWPARAVLLTATILHIWTALALAIENKSARPIPYVKKHTVQASQASLTMVFSGLVLLAFIVYHLLHFTFGITNPEFFHRLDSQGRFDVYSMVVLSFKNYIISGVYIVSMGLLGMHLSHGAPRFLQSLGLTNELTLKKMDFAGKILAWFLAIGNASIPISVMIGWIQLIPGGF